MVALALTGVNRSVKRGETGHRARGVTEEFACCGACAGLAARRGVYPQQMEWTLPIINWHDRVICHLEL